MNKDLQLKAAGKGIKQWQIAEEMGVAAETLCRWMRKPLSDERRQAFLSALEKLSQG